MTEPKEFSVSLTADELSNVTTALEHFLDYLEDHGRFDYDVDDLPEIVESYESALSKINGTAYDALAR